MSIASILIGLYVEINMRISLTLQENAASLFPLPSAPFLVLYTGRHSVAPTEIISCCAPLGALGSNLLVFCNLYPSLPP